MKKIIYILFVFILIIPLLFINISVKAENESLTLQDLLNNLNSLQGKYKKEEEEKKLTEEELNKIEKELTAIGIEITNSEAEVVTLNNDVLSLMDEIDTKKEEIKKLVKFIQQSGGENAYLEYAFGAKKISSFIYRMAVVEQLANYNNDLINQLNIAIKNSEIKHSSLKAKQNELADKKKNLLDKQEQLGIKSSIIDEDFKSLVEEIDLAKETIVNYENRGCSLNDTLKNCVNIPRDIDFLRPLMNGIITSGYGVRQSPFKPGSYEWHYALDIGGNPIGTSVYSTAKGIVALVSRPKTPNIANSSCGGNFIVIQHNINGIYYASRYYHLHEIYVNVGDSVDSNTVIGAVGGGESYDRCTTGPHLDFAIAKGIYGQDFYSFREPYSFNPMQLINFPTNGVGFNGRYTS